MIPVLTPDEALDLVADGVDDLAVGALAGRPLVAVEVTGDGPAAAAVERFASLLREAPVVLVGVHRSATSPPPSGTPLSGTPLSGTSPSSAPLSGLSPSSASPAGAIPTSVVAPSGPSPAHSGPPGAGLGLDVLLCEHEHPARPWVHCPDGVDAELERLASAVERSPGAAVALAQLLRLTEPLAAAEAVVAESWVYSLLQAGEQHRSWLQARADRARRPRPDRPVVVVDRRGDVLEVVLDRPEVRNAYGTRMRDELVAALQLVLVDPSIQRVELRGNGPAFCSGGDLDEFGTAGDPAAAHVVRTTRNAGIHLARLAPRVVAHVHGPCVGAGVELPAFAGRVVARTDATFLLPEVAMGLVPGAGGTSSIPRRVGRHRAAHLALAGRPIDATTALAWGLVDEIDDRAFPTSGPSPRPGHEARTPDARTPDAPTLTSGR